MVRESLKKGVHLWMLPLNTSHFLQPLDDVCFARFKQVFRTELRRVEFRGLLSKITHENEVYAVLYEVEQSVFTPRLI